MSNENISSFLYFELFLFQVITDRQTGKSRGYGFVSRTPKKKSKQKKKMIDYKCP